MEKKSINNYKMEKIADRMAKQYGKIREGEEVAYQEILHPMESNLLLVFQNHEDDRNYNSRRVIEAINLFLFIIKGYLNDVEYDLSSHENTGNQAYLEALQKACDPFYNNKVREALKNDFNFDDQEDVKTFFKDIIRCLIRIKESVEFWQSEWGRNGYFKYIKNHI